MPNGANVRREILVVDDQIGVRRLVCEALLDDGYAVDQASNGLEALQKINQQQYLLIMLDVKMPGINGLEVLEEIRKIDIQVPVIMMTAYGELDVIEQTRGLNVNYISKPFDLNDLRDMIKGIASDSKLGEA